MKSTIDPNTYIMVTPQEPFERGTRDLIITLFGPYDEEPDLTPFLDTLNAGRLLGREPGTLMLLFVDFKPGGYAGPLWGPGQLTLTFAEWETAERPAQCMPGAKLRVADMIPTVAALTNANEWKWREESRWGEHLSIEDPNDLSVFERAADDKGPTDEEIEWFGNILRSAENELDKETNPYHLPELDGWR